jgi:hypothetical protein
MQYGFAQTRPKYSINLNFLRSKLNITQNKFPFNRANPKNINGKIFSFFRKTQTGETDTTSPDMTCVT